MKKITVALLCGLLPSLLQTSLAEDNLQQSSDSATGKSGDIVIKGKKISQNASVGGNQKPTIGAGSTETTGQEKAKNPRLGRSAPAAQKQ